MTIVFLGLRLHPSGWHSRMFWGLRSLWMMPLVCSTFMAFAICRRNMRMVLSLSVTLAAGQEEDSLGETVARMTPAFEKKKKCNLV